LNDEHDYATISIGSFIARIMLSTIALLSSSRRLGNTGQLIDRIASELNIEVVDLASQRFSAYDYEHRNRNDDFEPLMKRVLAHLRDANLLVRCKSGNEGISRSDF